MERMSYYRVTYRGVFLRTLCAHSKWEAIDRVANENNQLIRKFLKAKKC